MKTLFSLCFLFLCTSLALAETSFKTNDIIHPTAPATWQFDHSSTVELQQVRTSQMLPLRHLQLQITDGKTGELLTLPTPKITSDKSTFTAQQSKNNLQITQQIRVLPIKKNAVQWNIEIANNGTQEVWLEAGLSGDVAGANLRFWDGYSTQEVSNKILQRSTPSMVFPATMIRAAQSDAVVVAMNPDNDMSWMTTSLNPAQQKYFYGGRFVIPAGQKVLFGYTLFTLSPQFGELDAIDGYYARFPQYFTPQPNTDPRLTGFRGVNSSYIPRNVTAIKDDPEVRSVANVERLYGSWDWGYDPYKFSGDWFARAEDWNLPLSQGDQLSLKESLDENGRFRGLNLRDIDQFHKDRIALFKRSVVRGNVPQAFYIVNFAQAELLEKYDWMKYTYGYRRYDDRTSGRIKHWVAPYDDTWHTFPWATPFGDTFKRDLPAILKVLNTSSFAIDLFADNAPYRGETTQYIPGWSYDENGKFIDTAIAHKHLVEYIHTLRGEQFAASLVANLSPFEHDPALKLDAKQKSITNYATAFTPDAYIMEGNMAEVVEYDTPGRLFPKRYLFGKKYISSVSGAYNDAIGERIPWRTMSPNQIREAVKKYYQKRVMAYYQGGFLPNYDDQRGIEFIADETPRLLEIQSRGFSAAPASVGNSQLQRRRYGTGTGAAIVYSNPVAKDISDTETIENKYFGSHFGIIRNAPPELRNKLVSQYPGGNNNAVIPFDADERKINFTQQTDHTSFELNVPSMENRIMLFPIALGTANNKNWSGTSQATLNAHQQQYEINLTTKQAQEVTLQIDAPRDFVLQSISVNGKAITDDLPTAALINGENTIKVLFTSTQFLALEKQYIDFPWNKYDIVVLGNKNDKTDSAAQIITDYSDYYLKFKPAVTHKSTFDAASVTNPTVVISTHPPIFPLKRGIYFETNPKVLLISGYDDFDTQQLAWRLMRLVDRTQQTLPGASFTNLSTKAMFDAIGLMYNAQKSSSAKQISLKSLAPVAGEDTPLSGNGGDVDALDFKKILPLPREGWKASASAIYTNDKTVSLEAALDDKPGTRWTGGKGKKGAWFMVDMQKPQTFNHLQLKSSYPWNYSPRHYKAELSDDGVNWRNAIEGEGATDGVQDTEIFWPQMQTARYIRVSLTEDQDQFWSIDEIYIYKRALAAEPSAPVPALDTLPHIQIPRIKQAIQIDGKLDEAAWQKAVTIELNVPLKNHPITQKTQAAIFHDGDSIYLGFTLHEANMNKLWETATERDGAVWDGDDVEIYLAPGNNEGRIKYPYYQFLFSPSGIQTDLKFDADGKGDIKWNGKWQVKTQKLADRWIAEMRIPLTDVEGSDKSTFRANIGRIETPNGDVTTWAPMQRIFAQPALFGIWSLMDN